MPLCSSQDGRKGILPSILTDLLLARKFAKKKMEEEEEHDKFKAKIWNGLQLAYKVTANSLYGQTGPKRVRSTKLKLLPQRRPLGDE